VDKVMSKRKERISAFLDNDLHSDELMSFSLSSEAQDAKCVQRYQIIGDAMRGEMSESSFVDISHAVREALREENIGDSAVSHTPVSHAPVSNTAAAGQTDSASGWSLSNWLRPVAGMAVAASVAVVVVFSVTGQSPTGSAPMVADAPVSVESQPVLQLAVEKRAIDNKAATEEVIADSADTPQLDPNLVNRHLEFATQDTLQGRLPYVRAVSFESKK
jgi:sigma-E factor negative regulatory protein RseA